MVGWVPGYLILFQGGDAGFFVRTLGAPATWQRIAMDSYIKKAKTCWKGLFLIKYIQIYPKTMIEQSEFASPTKFCEREREYGVVTTA